MGNQQRPEGAAPLGSKDFYEKVNPYWLDQAARLKDQATSRKQQAASRKPGGWALKRQVLTNKK